MTRRGMLRAAATVVVTVLTLLLLLLDASGTHAVRAATFAPTYSPQAPIADVAFNVTVDAKGYMLYASIDDCVSPLDTSEASCIVGNVLDPRFVGERTCSFRINRTSIGVDLNVYKDVTVVTRMHEVQLCIKMADTSTIDYKATLPLTTIMVSPRYLRLSQRNRIAFSANTPVGTRVGFGTRIDSTSGDVAYTALNESRLFDYNVPASTQQTAFYLFTQVRQPDGTYTAPIMQYWLPGLPNYNTADPTIVVSSRNVMLTLDNSPGQVINFALSNTSDCTVIVSDNTLNSNTDLRKINIKADVPAGNYTVCGAFAAALPGLYMPTLITLHVSAYHFLPSRVYANMPTSTYPYVANDARYKVDDYYAYAGTSANCKDSSVLTQWARSTYSRTFAPSAVYYTCVAPIIGNKIDMSAALATETLTLFAPPTLTTEYAIRGLYATIDIAGTSGDILLVLASGDSCTAAPRTVLRVARGTTSVRMRVPTTATATQLSVCASVPLSDEQMARQLTPEQLANERDIYLYTFATVPISEYALYYDAFLVNRTTSIGLDTRVTFSDGDKLAFAPPGASCSDVARTGSDVIDAATQRTVQRRFAQAGTWTLCMLAASESASAVFQPLRTLEVYGLAELQPRAAIANVTAAATVRGAPANAFVYLTQASPDAADAVCRNDATATSSGVVSSATTDANGNAQLSLCGVSSPATLQLCVAYPGASAAAASAAAAAATTTTTVLPQGNALTLTVPSAAPGIVLPDTRVRVYVDASNGTLLAGLTMCLVPDSATVAQPPSNDADCAGGAASTLAFDSATSSAGGGGGAPLPYATVNLRTPQAYVVFVRNAQCGAGAYVRLANTVTVREAVTVAVTASATRPLIANLPGALTFTGSAATFATLQPTNFVAVNGDAPCETAAAPTTTTAIRGTVTISPQSTTTYLSSAFVAPGDGVASVRVCFAQTLTSTNARDARTGQPLTWTSYLAVGTVRVTALQLQSHYAFIGRTNAFIFSPDVSPSSGAAGGDDVGFYLVKRSEGGNDATSACRTAPMAGRFVTGPRDALTSDGVIAGDLYYVCVRAGVAGVYGIAGAQPPLKAVAPWTLSLSGDAALRQFVPFAAKLTCVGADGAAAICDDATSTTTSSDSRTAPSARSASTSATTTTYTLRVQVAGTSCYTDADTSTTPTTPTTTPSESFTMTTNTEQWLYLTKIDAIANVTFCLVMGAYDTLPLLTTTMLRYVEPGVIVADRAVTFARFVDFGNAQGQLSSSVDCNDDVGASPRDVTALTFTLAECAGNNARLTAVYYCERNTTSSGPFAVRAMLPILRRNGCSAPGQPASIAAVTAAPGVRIDAFGLDAINNATSINGNNNNNGGGGATMRDGDTVLTDPRLYYDANCTRPVCDANATAATGDATASCVTDTPTYIYSPAYDEPVALYVCARVRYAAAANAPRFTTTAPTLRVRNWAVTPTTALSPSEVTPRTPTQLRISDAVYAGVPFLSKSAGCNDAPGVPADGFYVNTTTITPPAAPKTVPYTMATVDQVMYVCARVLGSSRQQPGGGGGDGGVVAIARFLSITAPTVPEHTPLIINGAPFYAQLRTRSDNGAVIYSMYPGADTNSTYRAFFVNADNRSVYLSDDDNCASSLTDMVTADASNNVRIPRVLWAKGSRAQTASRLMLCANTPAGASPTLAIASTNRTVLPPSYTSGTNATMYIPLHPNTNIVLAADEKSCAGANVLRARTDANGYATVLLNTPSSSGGNGGGGGAASSGGTVTTPAPLPAGNYMVCMTNGSSYSGIDTVQLYAAYHYDIRGDTLVTNVSSSVRLLDDLTVDKLVPGFFTSTTCGDDARTSAASWTRTPASSSSTTSSTASSTTWQPQMITALASEPQTPLYLCATTASGDRVALPAPPRSFTFAASDLTRSLAGPLDLCVLPTIDSCYPPGLSTPSDGQLVVIDGDCCAATRAPVLASSAMGGRCALEQRDAAAVARLRKNTIVSVCVWSDSDPGYCPTVARVPASAECANRDVAGGGSLLPGWLIAVIVVCIIVGLLLLALLIYLLWVCCCRPKRRGGAAVADKDHQLVALRQMEPSEYDYSMPADYYSMMSGTGAMGGGGGALLGGAAGGWMAAGGGAGASSSAVGGGGGSRHPLLYYPAASAGGGGVGASTFVSGSESNSSPTSASGNLRVLTAGSGGAAHSRQQQHQYTMNIGNSSSGGGGGMLGMTTATNASASMATRPSLVEGFEDEERDEVALQEARERYHMRVAFAEELERLRLLAKEAEVIVGYEDTDERLFAGNAAPELRSVEVLDVDGDGDAQQPSSSRGGRTTHTRSARHDHHEENEVVDVFAAGANDDGERGDGDAFAPLNFDQQTGLGGAHALATSSAAAAAARGRGARGASDVDSDASMSQLARMLSGDDAVAHTAAGAHDKTRTRSSSASSSTSGGGGGGNNARPSHIHFDTSAPAEARRGGTASRPLPADDDDDDMDELSFTTTQRFHDEKRFLLEQEDIRRQRLSNWEDEERALLAQDELNDYMQAITTVTANNSSVHTNHTNTAAPSSVERIVGDEVVYHAPLTPAQQQQQQQQQLRHSQSQSHSQPPQLTNETTTTVVVEKTQHHSSRRRRSHRSSSRTSDGRRRSSRGGGGNAAGASTTLGSIGQLDSELYPDHIDL